ncbi:MAG TPA: hypothetical protein VK961_06835 [Chthoniobacter sp.]|nr:hypothetical protein [Chthoniobacter sp.]
MKAWRVRRKTHPQLHEYRERNKPDAWLAIVQATEGGLWFWYGGGRNTTATPTTLEEAKRQVEEHFK